MGTARTWLLTGVAAGSLVAVVACGLAVPSGNLPKVEQRWVVTALVTSIDTAELTNPDKEVVAGPHPINVDDDTVAAIVDRVRGEVEIAVTFNNPFPIEVQGTFGLGDAVQLTAEQQSVTVRPGTGAQPVITTKEVTLTPEQLRAFLERGIFSFGGRVTTDDVVRLDTDKEIRVTITVGVSLVTEPEE